MAIKKITQAANFLAEYQQDFRCPICHQAMTATSTSLICANQHQFDLSKKGTLYFLQKQIKTEYTTEMLAARGRMIERGIYGPLLDLIADWLPVDNQLTIDVGCGEGGHLTQLAQRGLTGAKIGFDISKDGIYLASQQSHNETFWCVADLTNLPFADHSATTILNIFSPSHYREFARVLTTDGTFIKVIPGPNYLRELRQAFYPDNDKSSYSNAPVMQHLSETATILKQQELTYQFELTDTAAFTDLLQMSPLEWQASADKITALKQNPFHHISIDLQIVQCRLR